MLRNNEKQSIFGQEEILAITLSRLPVSVFYCHLTNLPKMYWLNNHRHLFAHDCVIRAGCGAMSLSVPGGFGWEPCFSPCGHSLPMWFSHHSVVNLSVFAWRLSSEGLRAEAAWPPKAWPRTGFHHSLVLKASHRAPGTLEERTQTPPLGGKSGMRLQEWGGCLVTSRVGSAPLHAVQRAATRLL